MSVPTYIHTYGTSSRLTVVAWRAGSAAFGLVTAPCPGVLAGCCKRAERTTESWNSAVATTREGLCEPCHHHRPPTSPHSLACLLARPGVYRPLLPLLLSAIQHPYPSHPSLDSSLLPVPSAEPAATTTPNGPSASDEPGLNHDPRGPPSALLCCRAAALVAAAVLLLTSPLHRLHHRAANWTPTLPGQPSLCNYRQPTCPSQTLLLTRAVSVELSSAALLA